MKKAKNFLLDCNDSDRISILIIQKLKKHRNNIGLSQKELSKKSGVSLFKISKIESNNGKPSMVDCLKLATALDIKLSDIIMEVERSL